MTGGTTRTQQLRHRRPPGRRHRHLLLVSVLAALAVLLPAMPAAADPVASSLELQVIDSSQLAGLTLRASVTPAAPIPTGVVVFSESGNEVGRASLAGGLANVTLDAPTVGPRTVTATYLGSADLLSDIGAGSFWFPPAQVTVDTGFFGLVQVTYRLSQDAPMTGHVAEDGTVAFDPATLRFEARSYSGGISGTLTGCTYGPIPMTLTGTADAGGLHLRVDDTIIPPLPSTGCSGLASLVDPRVAVASDIAFEVEGDFRRFAPSTPVTVATYFPSVAQYNQSYLVARIGSGTDIPTGDVTFRDGATVLGTAPIDATGHASLVASMDQPGTRTITAAYVGDTLHGPGSATTAVDVSPAPTGLALDGDLTVSGNALGIGAGPGQAAITKLAGGPVTTNLHAPL